VSLNHVIKISFDFDEKLASEVFGQCIDERAKTHNKLIDAGFIEALDIQREEFNA
jgi:hypothetical protein